MTENFRPAKTESNRPKGLSAWAMPFKWTVALGVLFLLFRQVEAGKLMEAMHHAQIGTYIPLAMGFVILWFLIESQNLTHLFTLFGHGVSFREMRRIRGASYMLMIINYNLGLGAMAWYLKKRKNIPLIRASSVMLFYYFVESVGITFFAMAGCAFLIDAAPVYGRIVMIAAAMFASYLSLFFAYRLLPARGMFQTLYNNELFKAFQQATLKGYLTLSLCRACYFGSFVIFFYFGLKSFQVTVPFFTLIGLVPVIFFIGNIPVTPFGLGTLQAAMLFFFKDYGNPENILSFGIAYSATLLFFRAPIGLFYLRSTDIDRMASTPVTVQEG